MLRSCLRAVEAVSRIPGVSACEPWRNFMQVGKVDLAQGGMCTSAIALSRMGCVLGI